MGFEVRQKRYRSKLDIIYNILECSELRISKTKIMYMANLSYSQIIKYLDYLIKNDLIEKIIKDNGREIFCITEKGKKVVDAYKTLYQLIMK